MTTGKEIYAKAVKAQKKANRKKALTDESVKKYTILTPDIIRNIIKVLKTVQY